MNFMDGLLGLVKAASLLRGDARSAYLMGKMQDELADKRAIDEVLGPTTTKQADGTKIQWGPRQLPTGAYSVMEGSAPGPEQMAALKGSASPIDAILRSQGGLPKPPMRGVSQALEQEQMGDIRGRLAATGGPTFRSLQATRAFDIPKPPAMEKLGQGDVLGYRDETGNWIETARNDAPAKAPTPSKLAQLQSEMDAMGPNDPRRASWAAAIKREAEGEAKAPEKVEPAWRIMNDEEKVAAGIPVSASVKTNGKDFQVMVQPKQDAPTETQAKAGTLAGRIVDALKNTSEIVAKDPGATTNWMLSTFGDNEYIGPSVKKYTNPNAQIFKNEMTDAIDAIITLGTGAAYTGEQLIAARNAYLPQPGEPEAVKDVKRKKLLNTYGLAKTAARTAGVDLPDPAALEALFGTPAAAGEKPMDGLPPGAVKQPDGTYKDPRTGETYEWQE